MAARGGLPVVEVAGKPYDMGRASGKKCASKGHAYRKAIAGSIKHSTGMDWERAVDRARLYLPHAEDFFPEFLDELRGYSDGSKMPFEDVFTLCCHELMSPQGFRGCTDIAVSGLVTRDEHVLAAHNEDWSSNQIDTIVLLHARPHGKPEFVCSSYAGLFPSAGMNSAGISLTGNALSPNDTRVGIPKMLPFRKAFEAKRIGEAISYAMPEGRASSYNNICSDKNGEIYSLEGSATDCAWLYAVDGYLVHTNHYLSPKMEAYEAEPYALSCSRVRYFRALKLLEQQLGGVTIESLTSILKDHVNKPGSICRHPDPLDDPFEPSETVFSIVFDVTTLDTYVCKGNPCYGKYSKFSLKS